MCQVNELYLKVNFTGANVKQKRNFQTPKKKNNTSSYQPYCPTASGSLNPIGNGPKMWMKLKLIVDKKRNMRTRKNNALHISSTRFNYTVAPYIYIRKERRI